MNFYFDEMKKRALLTREQEQELGRRIQAGDDAARETMILANLRLVVTIANQFTYAGVAVEDLIEEGNIGLMEAVDRFDPDNGARFSTYASWWIKQSIRRAFYNQSRTVRVPSNVHELSQKINRVAETMQCDVGGELDMAEIAECVGVAPRRLERVRDALRPIQSLDAPGGETEEEGPLADIIPDEQAALPSEFAMHRETLRQLEDAMQVLPERERDILRWRYGLAKSETLTLDQVGSRLGVSRERVRQLQNRAYQKLREEITQFDQESEFEAASVVHGDFQQVAVPA
jgi:RNA polymerase primary sigma factor